MLLLTIIRRCIVINSLMKFRYTSSHFWNEDEDVKKEEEEQEKMERDKEKTKKNEIYSFPLPFNKFHILLLFCFALFLHAWSLYCLLSWIWDEVLKAGILVKFLTKFLQKQAAYTIFIYKNKPYKNIRICKCRNYS